MAKYVPTGRPRGRPKGTTVEAGAINPHATRATNASTRTKAKSRIAIRNVIDPDELRFCQIFLAFGEKDRTEAYRRAFRRKNHKGEWIDIPRAAELTADELRAAPLLNANTANERSKALLKIKHIQDTLEELKGSPADHARQTLVDNILFGSSTEKKDAIKQIFADEDKLGFRDANVKWAEIMCDAGAEVVVPLGIVQRSLVCTHCGEASTVDVDLALEVPLLGLFPQHENSPADAPN